MVIFAILFFLFFRPDLPVVSVIFLSNQSAAPIDLLENTTKGIKDNERKDMEWYPESHSPAGWL